MHNLNNAIILFLPIVSVIAGCALLAVAIWAGQRRREREIHYRHELLKKFVEKGADKDELGALMREQDRARWANRREALKLAAIITLAVGVGSMIGLRFIDDEAIWLLGAVPTLLGVGLLFYAFFMAPSS
jgi:hypothetical protein